MINGPKLRRDGQVSLATDTNNLPDFRDSIDVQKQKCEAKGLNSQYMHNQSINHLRVWLDTVYFAKNCVYFAKNWKLKTIFLKKKKLLFTCLTLFISLKSLFMDNEHCQTHVEGKKKKKTQKMQRKKRNTQTPPKSWEWSLTFLKSYHQKQTL